MDNCQAFFFFFFSRGYQAVFIFWLPKGNYSILYSESRYLFFFFFIAADRFFDIVDVQSPDQYLEACYPFKLWTAKF